VGEGDGAGLVGSGSPVGVPGAVRVRVAAAVGLAAGGQVFHAIGRKSAGRAGVGVGSRVAVAEARAVALAVGVVEGVGVADGVFVAVGVGVAVPGLQSGAKPKS